MLSLPPQLQQHFVSLPQSHLHQQHHQAGSSSFVLNNYSHVQNYNHYHGNNTMGSSSSHGNRMQTFQSRTDKSYHSVPGSSFRDPHYKNSFRPPNSGWGPYEVDRKSQSSASKDCRMYPSRGASGCMVSVNNSSSVHEKKTQTSSVKSHYSSSSGAMWNSHYHKRPSSLQIPQKNSYPHHSKDMGSSRLHKQYSRKNLDIYTSSSESDHEHYRLQTCQARVHQVCSPNHVNLSDTNSEQECSSCKRLSDITLNVSNQSTFGSSDLPSEVSSYDSNIYRSRTPNYRGDCEDFYHGPPSPDFLPPKSESLPPSRKREEKENLSRDKCKKGEGEITEQCLHVHDQKYPTKVFDFSSYHSEIKGHASDSSDISIGSVQTARRSPIVSDFLPGSGSDSAQSEAIGGATSADLCMCANAHSLPSVITYCSSNREITYKIPTGIQKGEIKFVRDGGGGVSQCQGDCPPPPKISRLQSQRTSVHDNGNSSRHSASSCEDCKTCRALRQATGRTPPGHAHHTLPALPNIAVAPPRGRSKEAVVGETGDPHTMCDCLKCQTTDSLVPRRSIVVYTEPQGKHPS